MAVEIKIPITYRKYTDGKKVLESCPGRIRDILEKIMKDHPGLREKLLDENGEFKEHLNIFLNNQIVHIPEGLDTLAEDNDKLIVLLAISGG